DRRVDLRHKCRRNRDPRHAAEVRRGDEAGDVADAAAAERHENALPWHAELPPEPLGNGRRLGLLACGYLVRGLEDVAERELGGRPVDAGDVRIGDEGSRCAPRNEGRQQLEQAGREPDSRGYQDDVVRVARGRVGGVDVQRTASFVERVKLLLVPGERTIAVAHALPSRVGVYVEMDGEGAPAQLLADRRALDRPSPELDHGRLAVTQRGDRVLRLLGAEPFLSLVGEDFRDRAAKRALERAIDLQEPPPKPSRDLRTERRLPGAHEADQDEMAV